jgi:hypothetical protein
VVGSESRRFIGALGSGEFLKDLAPEVCCSGAIFFAEVKFSLESESSQ